MPFKYLLVFGKVKPDMTIIEALDKLKEIAEKEGFKILLQGIPMGMRDQVVVVFDVDESIDKFYPRVLEIEGPLTDGRTHAVYVP